MSYLTSPMLSSQLPSYWVDTHTHIYSDEFKQDRDDMLVRAEHAGVQKMYMPNIDHTSIDGMLELEQKNPVTCFPMMGLHPVQ